MTTIDREELERLLPHREPILMLDYAEGYEPGRTLTGVKHLGPEERHFEGHFPGNPVMPGVLLLEAMAQTGAALATKSFDLDPVREFFMLANVESARFRAPVLPGSTLYFRLELLGDRRGFYRFKGETLVEERRVADIEFLAKLVRTEPAE